MGLGAKGEMEVSRLNDALQIGWDSTAEIPVAARGFSVKILGDKGLVHEDVKNAVVVVTFYLFPQGAIQNFFNDFRNGECVKKPLEERALFFDETIADATD